MAKKSNRPRPEELGLPPQGVDSHAHLDAQEFAPEVDSILERARAAGIRRVVNVFLSFQAYAEGRKLFQPWPEVSFILGRHPHEAGDFSPEELNLMKGAFAEDSRLKAVGEIGLDFFYDFSPRQAQVKAFELQLGLAAELGLPAVLHSRDAFVETMEILLRLGFADKPVLWHCFGGDREQAEAILEHDKWLVSIPGVVSYRKSAGLRAAVEMIPLERMLIETDCPYLSPEPYRGRRNEPAYLGFTATAIAEIKGVSPQQVWARTAENAVSFFGL